MSKPIPNRGNKQNNSFMNNTFAQFDLSNSMQMPVHNNQMSAVIEEVINYKLMIDGKNRDSTYYPNPFCFNVTMGRSGNSITPHLDQSFKNVKYVKINYLILPRYIVYNLTVTNGLNTYSPNVSGTVLEQYRFIMLNIKELNNKLNFSTNNDSSDECFILYRHIHDTNASTDIWYALNPIIIYKQGELKNLNKLSIEILTDTNAPLILQSNSSGIVAPMSSTDINNPDIQTSNFGLYAPFCEILLNLEVGVFEFDINL